MLLRLNARSLAVKAYSEADRRLRSFLLTWLDTLAAVGVISAVILGTLTLSAVLAIRITDESRTAVVSLNELVRQKVRANHARYSHDFPFRWMCTPVTSFLCPRQNPSFARGGAADLAAGIGSPAARQLTRLV